MAFASGSVCENLPWSAPSETSQLASFCRPASFNSTESGTPLHSLQLAIPWMYWTGNPMFGLS